jgi:hypothetical protein
MLRTYTADSDILDSNRSYFSASIISLDHVDLINIACARWFRESWLVAEDHDLANMSGLSGPMISRSADIEVVG